MKTIALWIAVICSFAFMTGCSQQDGSVTTATNNPPATATNMPATPSMPAPSTNTSPAK